jgi:hypothetical protein
MESPTENPKGYNKESKRQDKDLVKCWWYRLRMRKVWHRYAVPFTWACAKNFTRMADLSAHIYLTNASMRSRKDEPCSCLSTWVSYTVSLA